MVEHIQDEKGPTVHLRICLDETVHNWVDCGSLQYALANRRRVVSSREGCVPSGARANKWETIIL